MTAEAMAPDHAATTVAPPPRVHRQRPGWMVIAAKEFADHLLSVRLYVLLAILGVAALVPMYFAADQIRSAAPAASETPAIFLFLLRLSPTNVSIVRFDLWVSMVAPLLGVAFSFDAINGERHEGTLPRLLSQPIHRDDVINGKFAGGLALIATVLIAVVLFVIGFGMLRLGVSPGLEEVLRLVAWSALTIVYVALWLAFGMLLSVVIRRAATSALVGLGTWLVIAVPIFGPFLFSFIGSALSPDDPNTQQLVERFLPSTLYIEASDVLLNPVQATTARSITLSQYFQVQSRLEGTTIGFDQSLLLIWPHIVILFALMIGCFALAYAQFMRQEVRA